MPDEDVSDIDSMGRRRVQDWQQNYYRMKLPDLLHKFDPQEPDEMTPNNPEIPKG